MMTLTGEAEKVCKSCPWSDKRALPYFLYCFRYDRCTKRIVQTEEEIDSEKVLIEKIQNYILKSLTSIKRYVEVTFDDVERIEKGASKRLAEAVVNLWDTGQINRYRVSENSVWIWRGA